MRPNWNNIGIGLSLCFVLWVFYKLSSFSGHKHSVADSIETSSHHHGESLTLEAAKEKIHDLKRKLELKELQSEERDQQDAPLKKFTGHRLVHLDLKGAPPKMPYLIKLLPSFKKWGATGLLVEYEDMFPYNGDLKILASPMAYSTSDINQLLDACKQSGLIVVPLVQTFGHLEFVLKHKQFAGLRETIQFTNSVCPKNNGSVPLVTKMIDQVLALHPGIKWFHVGADEVWNLKTCTTCKADRRNKAQLFIHHMTPVLKHVKSKGVTPLMWDDMMREWDVEHLKPLSGLVEPMIWAYRDRIRAYFPRGMWERYAQAFPKMWAASAFKGATRPNSNYVPVGFHVDNNMDWLRITTTHIPKSAQIEGIALTGWSRFDHYGTLCELLPAALPSLAFCLGALKEGSFAAPMKSPIMKDLGLSEDFDFYPRQFDEKYKPPTGTFPGHQIFTLVNKMEIAHYRLQGVLHREQSWMLKREEHDKFLSYYHVSDSSDYIKTTLDILGGMKEKIIEPLNEIYNEQVVKEWVNDKIDEALAQAREKNKKIQRLKNIAAEDIGSESH